MPPQAVRFLRGYMEDSLHEAAQGRELKIFSKYVRNPTWNMAYLYEEISTPLSPDCAPHRTRYERCWLGRFGFPQAKRLSEKDNWDLS